MLSNSWRQEAIGLFYAAKERATETSNTFLHLACCRAIEAMVAEGSWVPEELRSYAHETRLTYSPPALFHSATFVPKYVG